MPRKSLVLTLSSLLTVALLFHFGVIFLYLSPDNPVRTKYWDWIDSYMTPFFNQNWNLFAPNPVNRHENLQIRFQYMDENGRTQKTSWMEISRPIVLAVQKNHFSTNMRLSEFSSSVVHDFVWKKGQRRDEALKNMRRYAEHMVQDNQDDFQIPGKIELYQLRVEVNKFPRFNRRHLPDNRGEFSYSYTRWYPYQQNAK